MKNYKLKVSIHVFSLSIMVVGLSGCFDQGFSIGKVPARLPGNIFPISSPSASPSESPRASPTESPRASPSATPIPSPSATPIASPSATPIPSPSATPIPSPSATPIPSPSATPIPSPSATPRVVAPIAVDDGPFETAQNKILAIKTSDLLLNDSDPGQLAISFSGFDQPTSGTLTLSSGVLTFAPVQDFVGTATFVYRIKNTAGLQASAKVTINIRTAATEAMYAQTAGTLFRYDAATQVSTKIADFKLQNGSSVGIFDIAITASGLMYAVDGNALYYVDAATGILTLITSNFGGLGNINGLTALSDGRLVIGGSGVSTYNIVTKEVVVLVAPGVYQSSGDLIALPDGYLYLSATGGGSDQLIRIDPKTSAVVKMGDFGKTGVYGLGYANQKMYGFAGDGSVFEINPSNASISNSKSTSNTWYGATTNPVKW